MSTASTVLRTGPKRIGLTLLLIMGIKITVDCSAGNINGHLQLSERDAIEVFNSKNTVPKMLQKVELHTGI